MSAINLLQDNPALPPASTAERGRQLIHSLRWLGPQSALISSGGRDFGRSIEQSVKTLTKNNAALRLQVRNRNAAVVLTAKQYDEILEMKELFKEIITELHSHKLDLAGNEFDALFQRISSPATRDSVASLISASDDEINASFRPGLTETH